MVASLLDASVVVGLRAMLTAWAWSKLARWVHATTIVWKVLATQPRVVPSKARPAVALYVCQLVEAAVQVEHNIVRLDSPAIVKTCVLTTAHCQHQRQNQRPLPSRLRARRAWLPRKEIKSHHQTVGAQRGRPQLIHQRLYPWQDLRLWVLLLHSLKTKFS